jgi:Tfp pilus assembly pilus retraction ATPase PilT
VTTQLSNSLRGIIAQRLVPGANRKQRLLATEILVMNMAARTLIREKDFHKLFTLIQTSQRLGMHTMDEALLELYDAGEITYDIALSNAQDPSSLKSRIHENQTINS